MMNAFLLLPGSRFSISWPRGRAVCVRVFLLSAAVAAALCLCPALPALPAGAAPAATVGERFGAASSHIKLWDPAAVGAELDALAEAGLGWLRCDFAWSDLEPSPGEWNFAGADRVVEEAGRRGIRVLGILGTSPPWANGGHEWNWPPTDAAAWRNYARTVASRYAGRVSAWEIWNEQNIDAFWQPAPDPAAYVALLAEASPEIRAADPAAVIVMGGVAGLGSADLDAYLSAGAAEYIDALAYHPYAETIGREGQPEGDALRPKESLCREIVAFVRLLISRHTARDLGIWITEVGWTTSPESPAGVDEATQADYLLRTMVNYAATDVDRVIWFNLRDTHLNPWDRYGLLLFGFSPKPSYRYYSTFQEVFGPCTGPAPGAASFSCSAPASLEAHAFRLPSGGLVLSAWKSDDAPDVLTVTVPDPSLADPVRVDPASGAASPASGVSRDASGNITVTGLAAGRTPVILRLEKVSVSSVAPNQAYQHTFSMPINELAGTGFQPGARVRLEMDGKVIEAYAVNVVSPALITCTVGLFGVEPGAYDMVVTNPDGSRAKLEDGFRVISLCGAGSGTALLAAGIVLGLVSAAGGVRLRRSRRRHS